MKYVVPKPLFPKRWFRYGKDRNKNETKGRALKEEIVSEASAINKVSKDTKLMVVSVDGEMTELHIVDANGDFNGVVKLPTHTVRAALKRKQDALEAKNQLELSKGSGHLSEELDEKGNPFIISPNGTTEFGMIDQECADAIGTGVAAPIKLSQGNEQYGKIHIDLRLEQLKQNGYNSTEEFVNDVTTNYDEIRQGNMYHDENGNVKETFLVIKKVSKGVLFVELSKDGSYYEVNSGGEFRSNYIRKRELLWSPREVVTQSLDETDGVFSSEGGEGLTDREGSVSLPQSKSLSSDKVTQKKAIFHFEVL